MTIEDRKLIDNEFHNATINELEFDKDLIVPQLLEFAAVYEKRIKIIEERQKCNLH